MILNLLFIILVGLLHYLIKQQLKFYLNDWIIIVVVWIIVPIIFKIFSQIKNVSSNIFKWSVIYYFIISIVITGLFSIFIVLSVSKMDMM